MKNLLNRRQQLKALLNTAGQFLLLISTLAVFVELTRWGLSKNGDDNLEKGRKREVSPQRRPHYKSYGRDYWKGEK